jgi:hypothetical protein
MSISRSDIRKKQKPTNHPKQTICDELRKSDKLSLRVTGKTQHSFFPSQSGSIDIYKRAAFQQTLDIRSYERITNPSEVVVDTIHKSISILVYRDQAVTGTTSDRLFSCLVDYKDWMRTLSRQIAYHDYKVQYILSLNDTLFNERLSLSKKEELLKFSKENKSFKIVLGEVSLKHLGLEEYQAEEIAA